MVKFRGRVERIDELAEWGQRARAELLEAIGIRRHPLRWRRSPSRATIGWSIAPRAMATFRNLAIGALRTLDANNIAKTTKAIGEEPA